MSFIRLPRERVQTASLRDTFTRSPLYRGPRLALSGMAVVLPAVARQTEIENAGKPHRVDFSVGGPLNVNGASTAAGRDVTLTSSFRAARRDGKPSDPFHVDEGRIPSAA
jgi:hypothetical protein